MRTKQDRRGFLRLAAGAALAAPLARAARPLNVVLIYADDLGYGDLGCYGGPIRTPNLDGLAREGVRFTNFYSANPVCSPSRAALLTGRYPTRVGVPRVLFPNAKDGLSHDEKTLADLLKSAGYKTACVGKWHLGDAPEYLPTNRGFDEYFGIPYSNDMKPAKVLQNLETVELEAKQDTLTQRYAEHAVSFIERARDAPFFLYMPHTFPHIPLFASKNFLGKSKQGIYGDVVEELDWSVGEVLKALKKHGLDQNTLVMFSSDNGPWYQGSPGPLRGRKGMTWEGGVRVPFIARMPGAITAGRVVDAIGSTMDIVPTVTKLAGTRPLKSTDGIDIWPLLTGKTASIDREVLLYFDGWNLQCARWKNWKLHVGRYNSVTYSPAPQGGRKNWRLDPPELYNLDIDHDESYDVAAYNSKIVQEIQSRIERLLPSFPEEVRQAWAEAGVAHPASGSLPRGPRP